MSERSLNSSSDPHETFEENRKAVARVRSELEKLRNQLCLSEETMAAIDTIIEDFRERQRSAKERGRNSGFEGPG